MKTYLIFATFLALVALTIAGDDTGIPVEDGQASTKPNDESQTRIINGQLARRGDFPWQAGISYNLNGKNSFCGGSLISTRHILTAGHCVYNANSFVIQLGGIYANDRNEPGELTTSEISGWLVHPNYNPNNLNYDLAMIAMRYPVSYTTQIQPIRLANPNDVLGSNVNVMISGWGATQGGTTNIVNNLGYVQLTTITNNRCMDWFRPEWVPNFDACCDGSQYKSACYGDSGGGLTRLDSDSRRTLVGVFSFISERGCVVGAPSGYVRTASFNSWILNTMSRL